MPITPINFEEDASQYEEFVDEVIEDQEEAIEASPAGQASSIDSRMAEMEERLEMIQYYKLLLNGGFFNNPPNAAVAQKIEKEVAEYILTRLDSLLNMGSSPARGAVVQSQFTEEEATALKALAQPDTHKILTEVVTRVFSKISNNTKSKPAKTEAPKLAQRSVPQESVQKKPAPQQIAVKVRSPILRNQPAVITTPKSEEEPKKVEAKKTGPGPQRKQFKKVTRINQQTGEPEESVGTVNITPQARPMGAIQPVPVATSKGELEMQMQMSAQRTSTMGLNIFDQKLTK